MKPIVYVSSNEAKFHEVEASLAGLDIEWRRIQLPDILSIEPEKLITAKARLAFRELQGPFFMDHTGLYFGEYDFKLPGCIIDVMLEVVGNKGLCRALGADRRARAQTTMLYCDGMRFHLLHAATDGEVVTEPSGSGFGWDPIFLPTGASMTYGDMPETQRYEFSSRTKTCKQLRELLSTLR